MSSNRIWRRSWATRRIDVYVDSDQGGIVEAPRRVGTPVLYLKLSAP